MKFHWNQIEEIEESESSSQSQTFSSPRKDIYRIKDHNVFCDQERQTSNFFSCMSSFPFSVTIVAVLYETSQFIMCRVAFEEKDAGMFGIPGDDLAMIQKVVGLKEGIKVEVSSSFKWQISDTLYCWLIEKPKLSV